MPGWSGARRPTDATLRGAVCRLERLSRARHADALHQAFAAEPDDRAWTYLSVGPFADTQAYAAWVDGTEAADDPHFYAIVDALTERPLGAVALMAIRPQHGSIEIGHVRFSRALQRTRAATEAIFLLLRACFDLGYRRVEWKCDDLNAPSRRAARRFGFAYEGTFRNATVYKGRSRDTAWFAMTDDDWPDVRARFERWLDGSNFDADGVQRSRL